MSWYKTGSVSVIQNSNAVIGTGTAFIANGRVGDAFQGPDGDWYEVTNISSDTAMSIAPNYRGSTNPAGSYALAPMQGYNKDTADALRQASLQVGGALDGLEESVAEAAASAATATSAKNAAATSEENAADSANAAQASKDSAATSEGHAADSASAAQASEKAVATSETNAGISAAAAATSEANAVAAADIAANLGVGKGYIDGLVLIYTGRRSLTVTAGSAYIPALGKVVKLASDKVLTGLTFAASTFYHVYQFENAGVGDIELSTTAPVKYYGTAYVKGVDTSRRYLGSILSNINTDLWSWRHHPQRGTMMYTEGLPGQPPFVLLSGFTSTSVTPVDPTAGSTAAAPNATATEIHVVTAGFGMNYGPLDQTTGVSTPSNWGISAGLTNGAQQAQVPLTIQLSRTPASQGKFYAFLITSGTIASLYATGYSFER